MYLCDPSAPARIYHRLPEVKLIACLRHPTDRAYSHYWMARGKEHTDLDFEQIVRRRDDRFVERGRYDQQLGRYLSLFDRDQLLILIHEEVFSDPSKSLNRVCSFLGVDDTFYQAQEWIRSRENRAARSRSKLIHEVVHTAAKWMRHTEGARQILDVVKSTGLTDLIKDANQELRGYPEMDPEVRKELDEYYALTIQRVEEILGSRVEAWRSLLTQEFPELSREV